MNDVSKTKSQLIEEISELRERIAELEAFTSQAFHLDDDFNQTIIDTSPAFHVLIDAQGKTKMMNKVMLAALGYSEGEAQGKNYLSTFVPEGERDRLAELFEKQLLKGKSTVNQNYVLTKDGRELLIEWQGHPILNSKGEVESFLGVGLDITERKQAEEALQESEERFRRLSEATFEGIAITEKGIIVDANERLAEMFGYSLDEILGMQAANLVAPEERELVQERQQSGYEAPFTHRAVRKDKSSLFVEVRGKAIFYKGRSARVTSIRDITERKQAEAELQRSSKDEYKRREELEKLREISANMRQAEGSASLLQVVTKEVQELCQADITSSIVFKNPQAPVTFSAPEESFRLSQEQSVAITSALLNAKTGELSARIPGFETVLILRLQSSDMVHGAMLVASRTPDAFTTDAQNMLNPVADMTGTALHRIDIWETLEERVQQRTHDLVVLYNLITIISENWRLQDLLELSLVLTLETVKADRGVVYLIDEKDISVLKPVIQRGFGDGFEIEVGEMPNDELAREVFKKQKPLFLDTLGENPDFAKFKGVTSYAGIPIQARGVIRGVFSLFANEADAFGSAEMALLASIADHLGIGIENSVLYEKSRESAALEERHRLARNLHDSVSQLLYSLTLMTGTTKKMLEQGADLEAIKKSVSRLGDTAHQALKEMRLLLYELRPAVLDSEGLVNALQHRIGAVEKQLGVEVDFQVMDLPELPNNIEDGLYHIAMEALNNIVKHSESKAATIKLIIKDENIVMEISDDGIGFDTDLFQKGLGLRNMRERGQMLESEILVDSKPGEGTRVSIEVKIPSDSLVSS